MIKIIWSILNISILIYFLYLLVGFISKGKKIFSGNFKVVSILVLIIGIAQIFLASSIPENINTIKFEDKNAIQNSKIKSIIIEDNISLNINLLLEYSIDNNEIIPIESSSYITGFVNGFDWEFISIHIDKSKILEKSKFKVKGILKWNLFGITLFNQKKSLSVEIDTTQS